MDARLESLSGQIDRLRDFFDARFEKLEKSVHLMAETRIQHKFVWGILCAAIFGAAAFLFLKFFK